MHHTITALLRGGEAAFILSYTDYYDHDDDYYDHDDYCYDHVDHHDGMTDDIDFH